MNLGFSHDMAFASVAGTGEILHDRDKLEQLWGIGTQAWSDKNEPPQNTSKVVLVVHGETAQYLECALQTGSGRLPAQGPAHR